MTYLDWLFLIIPVVAIAYIGWKTHQYSHGKGVAGFLAGGRVGGRYVVAVASGEAAMGLISVVAMFELYYNSGFAIAFWQKLAMPVGLLVTLTGFVIYRYRETRVFTLGQLFELRYSRRFRIFIGFLAFGAGLLNFAIFPGVSARFVIHYAKLPLEVCLAGFCVETFPLVMGLCLGVALFVILIGGQLTIMVTDCVQGIFNYLGWALLFVAIFSVFSFRHFEEAMLSRGEGLSFVNPFDTGNLQDFNILYVLIGLLGIVYSRMAWQGTQSYNASAINAHEQKMAGVLGVWKDGFSSVMIMLLALGAFTFMTHPDFSAPAAGVQAELVERIDTGNTATTETLRKQMLVPVSLRHLLPVGAVGVFLAVMLFAMVSTDTTYMHSWGSIFVQDVLLPLRKKPFTTAQHLRILRCSILGVAIFSFCFSLFYGQTTYIIMFFSLTGALYLGGAGSVIIGGLYWRRGTTAGAWAAVIAGLCFALFGFFCTQYWSTLIYPWLAASHPDALSAAKQALEGLGRVLPIANWSVGPEKFPISGREISFLTMLVAITSYISVSLATCREKFNLERLLHRGPYRRADDGAALQGEDVPSGVLRKLLGITREYSRGDRILAASVFVWTMGNFAVFAVAALWNLVFGVWTDRSWFLYWKYYTIGLTAVVALVSTIWFTIGGISDLRKLFRRLRALQVSSADDGRVVEGVNADDVCRQTVREEEVIPNNKRSSP